MGRSIHYYNVYISDSNGRKTNLNITSLLDKIIVVDWKDRLRLINDLPVVMFGMKKPGRSVNRTISIGRYRKDVKPYIGDITKEEANLIKEDVIEMVTAVFVPEYKTAMIEYSQYGSKVKDIAEYLNTFLPDKWSVEFEPIDSERSLRDIKRSNDIRNIEIKLNAHSGLVNRFKTSDDSQTKSVIGNIIYNTAEVIKDSLNASVVNLSFGKGRFRNSIFNADEIINMIEMLDIENDNTIQALKVKYKNVSTGKVEEIDLKYVGILKDSIDIDDDLIDWQSTGDKMEVNYNRKNKPGNTAYTKKNYTFIEKELPQIKVKPTGNFRVKVEEGEREEE